MENFLNFEEFHKVYQTVTAPIFEKYETFRKREALKVILFLSTALILPLASFITLLYIDYDYRIWLIYLLIISLALGIYLIIRADRKIKNFSLALKKEGLPKLLNTAGIKWTNGKDIISRSDLILSGLFGEFEPRKTDDEFQGVYKGIPFKICETDLYYPFRDDLPIRIFKGVVIQLKSDKEIGEPTMAVTKGDITKISFKLLVMIFCIALPIFIYIVVILATENIYLLAILVIFLILSIFLSFYDRKNIKNMEEVKLEDPVFAKKFRAYSLNQIEARYWLTPGFLERFQHINLAFKASKAKCAFYSNKVMFALSSKQNLFEIGSLFKPLGNPQTADTFYQELASIFNMIDHMELREKIHRY